MAFKIVIKEQKLKLNGAKKDVQIVRPAKNRETASLENFFAYVEKSSALTRGDALSLFSSLQEFVARELADGRIVNLGEFGSFRFTPKCKAVVKGAEFKHDNLRNPGIVFTPGSLIREAQGKVRYTIVKPDGTKTEGSTGGGNGTIGG